MKNRIKLIMGMLSIISVYILGVVSTAHAALPERFDLRPNGVTPISETGQLGCGSCWTWGALASLESSILLEWGELTDFSENNMKNRHEYDYTPCAGGGINPAAAYLTSGKGPVYEMDDPYVPDETESSPADAARQYKVREILWLSPKDERANIDDIKNAVMNYGAVMSSFYYDVNNISNYYNEETASYHYTGDATGTNHSNTIVGWDDGFAKENFPIQPTNNGAWIVRSTWGVNYGEDGYFYLSYESAFAGYKAAVFHKAVRPLADEHIYQHDPLGMTGGTGYTGDHTIANVFTSIRTEFLRSVSFNTRCAGTDYELSVFVNPLVDSPQSGTLVWEDEGHFTYKGYYTVQIDDEISLFSGDTFSIVLRLVDTTGECPQLIPIETAIPGISSAVSVGPKESYFYDPYLEAWTDSTLDESPSNFCIKGFTTTTLEEEPSSTDNDTDSNSPGENGDTESDTVEYEGLDNIVTTNDIDSGDESCGCTTVGTYSKLSIFEILFSL